MFPRRFAFPFTALLLLCGAAFVSAEIVAVLVEWALPLPVPEPGDRAGVRGGRAPRVAADVLPNNLVRLRRAEETPPSDLGAELVAVVATAAGAGSFALLRDAPGGDARIVRVGDVLGDDATVVRISPRSLHLRRAARLEALHLFGGASARAALSPGTRLVSRGELDELARAEGIRALPRYRGGRMDGVRFEHVRPGSVYHRLGLRSGDAIRKVGDVALDRMEAVVEALSAALRRRRTAIAVERGGSMRTLSFERGQ